MTISKAKLRDAIEDTLHYMDALWDDEVSVQVSVNYIHTIRDLLWDYYDQLVADEQPAQATPVTTPWWPTTSPYYTGSGTTHSEPLPEWRTVATCNTETPKN